MVHYIDWRNLVRRVEVVGTVDIGYDMGYVGIHYVVVDVVDVLNVLEVSIVSYLFHLCMSLGGNLRCWTCNEVNSWRNLVDSVLDAPSCLD